MELLVAEEGCSFILNGVAPVRLPWRGIQIERGGANNRLLFVSHPAFPDWRIAVADPNFPKLLTTIRHDDVQTALGASHAVRRRGLLIAALLLLGLAGLAYATYHLKEPAVRLVTNAIPLSWEEQAGEKLFALHKASGKVIDDKNVRLALDKFTAPLLVELKKTGYAPQVFVEQSEELNAFALPGGYVVLNTEVLKRAETPEEVLGVLAHEFAHVSERHVLRGLISSIGVYFGVSILIGDYAGSLAAISDALPQLLSLSFSRDYEREADNVGFGFLTRANINPAGMVEFFRKVQEAEKKQLGAISDVTAGLSFLSTHPTTDERIASLEQKLREANSAEKSAKSAKSYIILTEAFNELKLAIEESKAP